MPQANATPDELRRALARALAAGLSAYRVDGHDDLWAVQSESKSDSCYLVGPDGCGCEAGRRAIPCKHYALKEHRAGRLPATLVQAAEVTPLSRARRPLPAKPATATGPLTERTELRRRKDAALLDLYGPESA